MNFLSLRVAAFALTVLVGMPNVDAQTHDNKIITFEGSLENQLFGTKLPKPLKFTSIDEFVRWCNQKGASVGGRYFATFASNDRGVQNHDSGNHIWNGLDRNADFVTQLRTGLGFNNVWIDDIAMGCSNDVVEMRIRIHGSGRVTSIEYLQKGFFTHESVDQMARSWGSVVRNDGYIRRLNIGQSGGAELYIQSGRVSFGSSMFNHEGLYVRFSDYKQVRGTDIEGRNRKLALEHLERSAAVPVID